MTLRGEKIAWKFENYFDQIFLFKSLLLLNHMYSDAIFTNVWVAKIIFDIGYSYISLVTPKFHFIQIEFVQTTTNLLFKNIFSFQVLFLAITITIKMFQIHSRS